MANSKPLPSLEFLHECFELSDESPSGLVWKHRPRHHFNTDRGWNQLGKGYAGKTAGSILNLPYGRQYWTVQTSGSMFYVHRIVYTMIHGIILSEDIEIDHKDADGLNNTSLNLRLAESAQNCHNTRRYKNNSSGLKGVTWSVWGNYWMGRVMYKGKLHHIRGCATPEIANCLIQELREKLHKEFTNHG